MYKVPSFSKPDDHYYVNMELGVCDCEIGIDGSPCKHQYVTLMLHQNNANFIPYLSAEDRKTCSYIAVGSVLDDSYYEPLHAESLREAHEDSEQQVEVNSDLISSR